jgi:hypothetical protein
MSDDVLNGGENSRTDNNGTLGFPAYRVGGPESLGRPRNYYDYGPRVTAWAALYENNVLGDQGTYDQ